MILALSFLFLTSVRGQGIPTGLRESGDYTDRGAGYYSRGQEAAFGDVGQFERGGRGETGETINAAGYGYDYGSAGGETGGYRYGGRDRDMYNYGSRGGAEIDYRGAVGANDYTDRTSERYGFDGSSERGYDYDIGGGAGQSFGGSSSGLPDYNSAITDGSRGYFETGSEGGVRSMDRYGYGGDVGGAEMYGYGGNGVDGYRDREGRGYDVGTGREQGFGGSVNQALDYSDGNIGSDYAVGGRDNYGYNRDSGDVNDYIGVEREDYGVESSTRGEFQYGRDARNVGNFEQYGINEYDAGITGAGAGGEEYAYSESNGYDVGPGNVMDGGQGVGYEYETESDYRGVAGGFDVFEQSQMSYRPERPDRNRGREIVDYENNMGEQYTESEYGPYDPYTYSGSETFNDFSSRPEDYARSRHQQHSRSRQDRHFMDFSRADEVTDYSGGDSGYSDFFGGQDYDYGDSMSSNNMYEAQLLNPYRRNDFGRGRGHSFMPVGGGRGNRRGELEGELEEPNSYDSEEYAEEHDLKVHEPPRRSRRPPRRPSRRRGRRRHMFRRPFPIKQGRERQRRPRYQRRYRPISPYANKQRRRRPRQRTRMYRPKVSYRRGPGPRPPQIKQQHKHRPNYKNHRRPRPKHSKKSKYIPQRRPNKVQSKPPKKPQPRPRIYRPRPQGKSPPRPQKKYRPRPQKKYRPRPQKKYRPRPQKKYRPMPPRKNRPRPLRNYRSRMHRRYRPRPQKKYQQKPQKKYQQKPKRKYRQRPRKRYQFRPLRMRQPRRMRKYRPRPHINQGKKMTRRPKQRQQQKPRLKPEHKYKRRS
jgi:hypothetical protein